jgi:hypothetical protein
MVVFPLTPVRASRPRRRRCHRLSILLENVKADRAPGIPMLAAFSESRRVFSRQPQERGQGARSSAWAGLRSKRAHRARQAGGAAAARGLRGRRPPTARRRRSRGPRGREAAAREVREAAPREACDVREAGEARGAELEADAQAILEERARRIAELRDLVRRLGDFTDAAANRYPSPRLPVAEVPEPGPDEDPADLDSAP